MIRRVGAGRETGMEAVQARKAGGMRCSMAISFIWKISIYTAPFSFIATNSIYRLKNLFILDIIKGN